MLVLTRRIGDTLVIEFNGQRVDVIPMSINGSQVKLGVKADPDVTIDREEIYNQKRGENNVN